MDYWDLDELRDVYLEDSWVLSIVVDPIQVRLDLDLVLRESHRLYQEPAPDEQYCYKRASLVFVDVGSVVWGDRGAPHAEDATGTSDYGNIDLLERDDGVYRLQGEWGSMALTTLSPPRVIFDDVRGISIGA